MLDELVKHLRNCGNLEIDGCKDCELQDTEMLCNQRLMIQAADAIEELSAKYQKALDDLVKQGRTKKEKTDA